MKNGDNISINSFIIGLNDIINQRPSAEVVWSCAMFLTFVQVESVCSLCSDSSFKHHEKEKTKNQDCSVTVSSEYNITWFKL